MSQTAAHTPGPWRLRMHPAEPSLERPEYPDAVVDAKNHNVVFACITMTTSREGEWLANARLIAAAPDMLAALNEIKVFAEMQVEDLCAEAQEGGPIARMELARWSLVLSAIAKAEGRS